MRKVRRSGTAPELVVRRLVRDLGFRYCTNVVPLPGSPDLANRKRRWAILVHGCFWHGHSGCRLATQPQPNGAQWAHKVATNRERDARNIAALREQGLSVLVVWECETHNDTRLRGRLRRFLAHD
jgi:DNA mismatch endonuclease (patch repair protein)